MSKRPIFEACKNPSMVSRSSSPCSAAIFERVDAVEQQVG